MPRRTNRFQQLVRKIYDEITPHGATLTESALLAERTSGAAREVDVLIELTVAGSVLRMAVECRDESRPVDVAWIDQLLGKYRDLPIHSVIAVSSSGFTPAALQKATATNIETRTLREALDVDWAKAFLRVAIARVGVDIRPVSFGLATLPTWPDEHQPSRIQVGDVMMTSDQWLQGAFDVMRDQVAEVVAPKLGGDWRKLASAKHNIEVEWIVSTPNTIFVASAGTSHALSEVNIRAQIFFRHEWLPVSNLSFGDIGVSTTVDESDVTNPVAVMLVQEPGKPLRDAVIFDAVPEKK